MTPRRLLFFLPQHVITAIVQVRQGAGLLAFDSPAAVIETHRISEVPAAIRAVEDAVRTHGYHAVGFVTYEAGGAYGLPVHPPAANEPLVWFALFPTAEEVRLADVRHGEGYTIDGLEPTLSRDVFRERFERIKTHLGDGDTYQVNYTFALEGRFRGQPVDLF